MTMSKYPFLLIICVTLSVFLLPRCIAEHHETEPPFTYEEGTGKGPSEWGNLKPEWKACGNGKMQSPIDLSEKRAEVMPQLGELQKYYRPAPATLVNRGYEIEVRLKGNAGKININGTDYHLVQCHWHSPSEHALNGSRHNLELHIVHNSSKGNIAVIGIVYKFGHPDPFLSKLLPYIKRARKAAEQDLGVINPGQFEFGSRGYYRYLGSLTTPPCSEGVVWTIINKVKTASREQVQALQDAVLDGFEQNARPLQPLNGRPIFLYNP